MEIRALPGLPIAACAKTFEDAAEIFLSHAVALSICRARKQETVIWG